MKTWVLVGVLVFCLQVQAQAGVWDSTVGAVGSAVKSSLTITHQVLHIGERVLDGVMDVVHSSLDLVGIPFENGE